MKRNILKGRSERKDIKVMNMWENWEHTVLSFLSNTKIQTSKSKIKLNLYIKHKHTMHLKTNTLKSRTEFTKIQYKLNSPISPPNKNSIAIRYKLQNTQLNKQKEEEEEEKWQTCASTSGTSLFRTLLLQDEARPNEHTRRHR